MNKITVYEKPTCTTCRKVVKSFSEQGINFEKVNYYLKPFSEDLLKSLLKKLHMKPSELLRKNDKTYRALKTKIEQLDEEGIIAIMIDNPDLIQRPIVDNGKKAILARPPEKASEILK